MGYQNKPFKKENLGRTIKKFRVLHDLTVDDLARLLDLSTAFVGLIERGHRGVNLKNLVKLSEIFNVDINELLYGDDEDEDYDDRRRGVPGFSEPKKALSEEERDKKLKTLNSLCTGLDENEIEFLIENIKSLKKLKYKSAD